MPASLISTPGAITSLCRLRGGGPLLSPAGVAAASTTLARDRLAQGLARQGGYLSVSITSTNTLSSAQISAKDPFLLDGGPNPLSSTNQSSSRGFGQSGTDRGRYNQIRGDRRIPRTVGCDACPGR